MPWRHTSNGTVEKNHVPSWLPAVGELALLLFLTAACFLGLLVVALRARSRKKLFKIAEVCMFFSVEDLAAF